MIPYGYHITLTIIPRSGEQTSLPSTWRHTWWLSDIFNCVIATAIFATIIGVLRSHDGRLLPEWPFRITIKALLSVLIALFKIAMLVPLCESIDEENLLQRSSNIRDAWLTMIRASKVAVVPPDSSPRGHQPV